MSRMLDSDPAKRAVRIGTQVRCGGNEWWLPGEWPDKGEGAPATADGGGSLPLLGTGPQRLGLAHSAMCRCAGGVHLGLLFSFCLLLVEASANSLYVYNFQVLKKKKYYGFVKNKKNM